MKNILNQLSMSFFALLFPKKFELMSLIMKDNEELMGISIEQIKYIQELEDKIHQLDYEKEDLELKVERQEDTISDLEADLEDTNHELSRAEDRAYDLEDEVYSLDREIDSLRDEISDLEIEIENMKE